MVFFTGFATGAGVLISRYFGAHERENVHKAVQTTIALTIILSVALSVVGVWMTPLMLRAMQTPDDVIVQAEEYLRIYFAGLSGLLLYNSGSGILRAVGDTKRPLYFSGGVCGCQHGARYRVCCGVPDGNCRCCDCNGDCTAGFGGADAHGSDTDGGGIPRDTPGASVDKELLRENLRAGSARGAAIGCDLVFQRVCPVVYQPFWL